MLGSRRSCASAFSRVSTTLRQSRTRAVSFCLLALACTRPAGKAEPAPTAAAATTSASISVAPAADRAEPEDRRDPDEPVAVKSIGHTSYVLKVTLADGTVGVFKPRSRRTLGDRRYRGEIAAYRLGTALGLDNVPRATPRAFDAAALRAACTTPGNAERLDREALVDPDGKLRGAFIDWIDDYRDLPLEDAAWRARWEPWLMAPAAHVPKADLALASAISTMLAFDYVTGNWDRWSGGNVARAGAEGRLLYVDNDGAFYERPPQESLERQLAVLRRVVRFSRRFVDALRALDPPKLAAALGEAEPGDPLLPRAVLAGVDERRRTIVELVEDRVARSGDRATLAFE